MKTILLSIFFILISIFLVRDLKGVMEFSRSQLDNSVIRTEHNVKFSLVNYQILVAVFINDEGPFNMYIDSGVYPSTISNSLAQKLNIKISESGGYVKGLGHRNIRYFNSQIEKIKLGTLEFENLEAVVTDHEHLKGFDFELHGILGYSFLRQFVTTIDYKNGNLTFRNNSDNFLQTIKSGKRKIIEMPFRLVGNTPLLKEIYINGIKTSFYLDTGAGTTLILSANTVKNLKLYERPEISKEIMAVGSRGSFKLKTIGLNAVSVGGFKVGPIDAVYFEKGGYNIMGNKFLQRYSITVDYNNQIVFFEK